VRLISLAVPIATLAACAGPATEVRLPEEVESVVHEFFSGIEEGDVERLRGIVTADFEIIDGGQRLSMAQFEDMLAEIEEEGIELRFQLSEFNTEIAGEVAYTSLRSEDPGRGLVFFETATLRRVDGRWVMDRFTSTPRRAPAPETG
jgi:hypothetical protein